VITSQIQAPKIRSYRFQNSDEKIEDYSDAASEDARENKVDFSENRIKMTSSSL
jgi:hypothetical protein